MRHIHFIGIGGIGVSGIAQLALKNGDAVSGSDKSETTITRKLSKMGANVFIGHKGEYAKGADLVVYSSAIRSDNPEMVQARMQGTPIKKRAEFLCELMSDKKVIAVTGAHGKTTTSSLAARLLFTSGLHPTVAVGGIIRENGENANLGNSSYFVAEADESDGTFLCYEPLYSIITNIDHEHLDFYKTFDNLLKSFSEFVERTKESGCVFYLYEDQLLRAIVKKSGRRHTSFGFSKDADFYPEGISLSQGKFSFICMDHGRALGEVSLALNGRHNVLNALAVIALGMELGLEFQNIKDSLKGFKGVERRFQVKYEDRDILIVDDYAHHPTEIAATIEAAGVCQRKRLIVVFQPHRYSRTKMLMDRFPQSFSKCDHLIVTDIYAAAEESIEGITAQALVDRIKKEVFIPVEYVAFDMIVGHLKSFFKKGDFVLFLGAGDITKVSDEFAKNFQKQD